MNPTPDMQPPFSLIHDSPFRIPGSTPSTSHWIIFRLKLVRRFVIRTYDLGYVHCFQVLFCKIIIHYKFILLIIKSQGLLGNYVTLPG